MTDKSDRNVTSFKPKEVEMMMSDWASPGNPTPYELRVTLQTCKRILQANYDALESDECDREKTERNIKVLERNYMVLMDYLVDR